MAKKLSQKSVQHSLSQQSIDQLRKTGWLTFFAVCVAVIPLVINGLSVIRSIGFSYNYSQYATKGDNTIHALEQATAPGSGIEILFAAGTIVVCVFFALWLFHARKNLQELTPTNAEEKLLSAQVQLLKFIKTISIIQIIVITLVIVGIAMALIALSIWGQMGQIFMK